MRQKRKLSVLYCVSASSVISVLLGIVTLIIWPSILRTIYKTQFVLRPDSKIYDLWKVNPFPVYMDFYFFNWTNPQDFYNLSIKPRFKQIGPYRFSETKKAVNVTFHDGNSTLTYKRQRTWHFVERFPGDESLLDAVTTINPISVSASYATRYWSSVMKTGLSVSLATMAPSVYVTKTVGQMLFEGYNDPLINMARAMDLATLPPIDKFGWFYGRNNSVDFDGIFNIGTGVNNDLGNIYSWNHVNRTQFYDGRCGEIRGSSGELYTGNRTKDPVEFFSPDMCKTVTLDYVDTTKVDNILGFKYSAGDSFLDNGDELPENSCNCPGECLPSGAINISACRYGSPGFVSLPHFYKADPWYINSVDGLEPSEDKHDFYMTMEPKTGIPLEVAARLQLNLYVQPVEGTRMFERAPRLMFPMLWFEQKVTIPGSMSLQLKMLINFPIICTTAGVVLLIVGLMLFTCVCYRVCTCNLCERYDDTKDVKERLALNTRRNKPVIVSRT